MAAISPTESGLQTAIGAFLDAVLPSDVESYAGIVNRVPEPPAARYVTFIPLRFDRLRTNVDAWADCRFTGAIAATVLTATFGADDFGTINVGATVFGTGVTAGTKIVEQLTGPTGGAGTYTVSVSQTVASETLSAGQKSVEQGAKATVQLDFHAANNTASDLAQTVATLLRDPFGVEFFAGLVGAGAGVVPLYADDPRYMPFVNENQQSEWRWVLEACFQVNQTAVVPKQFADATVVDIVDVSASFPPS
jgi:hypothetical protein